MTEKCSAVSVCFNNEVNELGCVGVPFLKTNVKVYDNENNMELPYNEVGEICVSAPDVMIGYYNNEAETKNVIKVHDDGSTWLHSGDLGYITPEGKLFIVGRIKDIVIRYDGIKIYPHNVETILLRHPLIKSAAVIGIPDPNHYGGEIPVAYIVLEDNVDKAEVLEDIEKYALNNVVDYAVPTEYMVVNDLPITQVGKVDKKELKRKLC